MIDRTTLDDHELDAALRELDAASTALSPAQRARKEALLDNVLREQPDGPAAPVVELPRRRRRAARWLVPVAAASGLVTVLFVTGGPGDTPAYASWTSEARPVTGDVLTTAEKACRTSMAETNSRLSEVPADQRPTTRPETAKTVVAEKRGNYLFLAMTTDDGSTAQCFFDADDPARVQGMTGGSSTPSSPRPKPLQPSQIEGDGGGMSSGPEGSYAFAQGRVGSGIKGVTLRTEGRTVRATVAGGYYAAWWPTQAGPEPGPPPAIAYDVTLGDGTVRKDVSASDEPARAEPGPRQIGLVERGGMTSQDGEFSTASGRVGAQVTGVTLRIGGRKVVATVENGTFRAQWPSESSGELSAVTYDLTLADGTILTGQQPVS